jgi:hypothetical protein
MLVNIEKMPHLACVFAPFLSPECLPKIKICHAFLACAGT